MDRKQVLAWLEKTGTRKDRDGLARFAIPADKAFGVPVGKLRAQAKKIGHDHALALDLWRSGFLEARLLSAFIDDPEQVTPAQMDAWCKDFDNWAVVDTLCFACWDRAPHAWPKVSKWAKEKGEFQKRAAFAMLWSLSVHDKHAPDEPFLRGLSLCEKAADDERNFVKKAVNMALRATGKRNTALNKAAIQVAQRLAASDNAAARWNGKDALRELKSPSVINRLGRKK